MRKLKNNKGFTLVEIIVVLVILAILAAAMIPAMLGYVEESRGKTYADQARVAYNACQTCATEASALGAANDDIEAALNAYLAGDEYTEDGPQKNVAAKVKNLIGKDIMTDDDTPRITVVMSDTEGSVGEVFYCSGTTVDAKHYVVWVDVTSGTTTVERGDKLDVIASAENAPDWAAGEGG